MNARDALGAAVDALTAAGCETPRLDAELLIADALGVGRSALVVDPGLAVPGAAARVIGERVRRRIEREPVAYILGVKGFRRIELLVDRRVLIPRPETELLVEVALELPAGARVHDVGTGSGAVALALRDERPDLAVTASDASPAAVEVARANGPDAFVHRGLPVGERELVVANLPYVREDEWGGLAPEIRLWEPREALVGGADGLDAIRALIAQAPPGTRVALEHAPQQTEAVQRLLRSPRVYPDLAGLPRVTAGRFRDLTMTAEEVETFERCIAVGGVALFGADTVYGLATEPDSAEGVRRLYALKGRRADRPAAVMFFDVELAVAALPELPEATRGALERLLPGAVTLLVPNPARRFPLACADAPDVLGLRVPRLEGERAPLAAVTWPVLQSSANVSGGAEARRVDEVDERVRAGVDLVLDGGELPGTASTVVDLTAYDRDGSWQVLREGALPRNRVEALLASTR